LGASGEQLFPAGQPVQEFSVTGALYTCRPDLVGFVNGLPRVVIE